MRDLSVVEKVVKMESLLPLVVGFVLTTVLGGLLGYVFQSRTWRHQHVVQGHDRDRERATQIFDEISRLLDRRLYRQRLLHWSLRRSLLEGEAAEELDQCMTEYRQVLREWNDSINRNLALTQQYFGQDMRKELDGRVGGTFVGVGAKLERLYKAVRRGEQASPERLDAQLDQLATLVYNLNLKMISAIQRGAVGDRLIQRD